MNAARGREVEHGDAVVGEGQTGPVRRPVHLADAASLTSFRETLALARLAEVDDAENPEFVERVNVRNDADDERQPTDNEFDLVVSFHVIEHVPDVMGFITEIYRITKPGGRIRFVTPHYTNPDWANDPTHRNHINSYTFNTFLPGRQVFDFYTDVQLRPLRCHVSLLSLWKYLGIQFLVNLDQRAYSFRFVRKFWEQYLSYIIRGKELTFEFEVVKKDI